MWIKQGKKKNYGHRKGKSLVLKQSPPVAARREVMAIGTDCNADT